MREVTEKEFWEAVMKTTLNVHPTPVGKYPYTSIFKVQDGTEREFGRIAPETDRHTYPPAYKYFLAK